jgi:hypothetical protein
MVSPFIAGGCVMETCQVLVRSGFGDGAELGWIGLC